MVPLKARSYRGLPSQRLSNSLHLRAYHQLWDKGHPQFGRKSGVRVVPLKSPWHTHNLSPSRYVISPILRTNRHTSFAWGQPQVGGIVWIVALCGRVWHRVKSRHIGRNLSIETDTSWHRLRANRIQFLSAWVTPPFPSN
jgi:hypothetical protein